MSIHHREQKNIEKVISHLKNCKSILFITGAGLSADSNLPTYRGIGGLYNDEHTEDGIPIEEALSGAMLVRRPALTWRYISRIEAACRDAVFNRGHQVIAEMERHFPRVWVLTQNVDGFHHRAGSKNIIDIHGDVHSLCCTHCNHRRNVEDYSTLNIPPQCPSCSALERPEVVLFGEMLPPDKLFQLEKILYEGFHLVFSIGTSSLFPYIVQPVMEARALGTPTVEINPDQTDISQMVDVKITARAAEALDAIWSGYQKAMGINPTSGFNGSDT